MTTPMWVTVWVLAVGGGLAFPAVVAWTAIGEWRRHRFFRRGIRPRGSSR